MTLEKDDPKLTAYALGELSPAERAEVEAAIAQDAALRAEVEAIQGLGAALGAALQEEPAPRLAETQRAAIESRAAGSSGRAPAAQGKGLKLLLWTAVPGALAASLLIAISPAGYGPMAQRVDVTIRGTTGHAGGAPAPAMDEAHDARREVDRAEARRQWEAKRQEEQELLMAEMQRARDVQAQKELRTPRLDPPPPPMDPAAEAEVKPATRPEPAKPLTATPVPPRNQPAQEPQRRGADADKKKADEQLGRRPAELDDDPNRYGFAPDTTPGTEEHGPIEENPFVATLPRADNLSTFSVDVDRASYSLVRRWLTRQGSWPPADAVRIEEMVNYFPYSDAPPAADADHPFAVNVEVAGCPWTPANRLVRIGLKGKVIQAAERPAANLVFLIDVSGSMNRPNRLPLVVESMKLLTRHLNARDQVAIVVYAGASGLVLPITSCDDSDAILRALERLQAGGSTNGGAGIELAYRVAQEGFIEGGTNRVILCTDGDFNVGVTNDGSLVRLIQEKARTKVFLTVLGFGMGNLKDGRLEALADKGNGNYGYVDSLEEAKKLLVDELSGTLVAIAKDVKVQVDFNWAKVASYRLIGYENRKLAARDFTDDTKDAGEIGAGHAVTALYEVVPVGGTEPGVQPSEYSTPAAPGEATSPNLLTVRLRYKQPEGDVSTELRVPVIDQGQGFSAASPDLRFAAGVAAFGMVLRGSRHAGAASLELAREIADGSHADDPVRLELLQLIEAARRLQPRRR